MPSEEESTPSEDDDLPDQPPELRALRQLLPGEIQVLVGARRRELLVEVTISEKILRVHPADHAYFQELGQLMDSWEFAGYSPKSPDRIEIYGKLDEIWFTTVVRGDQTYGYSSLITMHRIYRRKVESRARKGYLVRRED